MESRREKGYYWILLHDHDKKMDHWEVGHWDGQVWNIKKQMSSFSDAVCKKILPERIICPEERLGYEAIFFPVTHH